MLISPLVFIVLFTSVALGDRPRKYRRSRFLKPVHQPANTADGVEYNSGWAGAVWERDNNTFTAVTGTVTIPVPSGSRGSAAAVWVGIDGHTCTNGGLLQTGVDLNVGDDGATYDAWYEWYPDWSHYFDGLTVSAGDVIRSTVVVLSATTGTAIIENLTRGQRASVSLNSTYALCGQNAEWIVEDFEDWNGNQVPFANFGTVAFTDSMAFGAGGAYTPDGAAVVDVQKNEQTLTSVDIKGSSITIKHM